MHKVYFVGCGPGDPDLITVKAKKLMQKAQTIVYSGSLIPPKTLKICKGEMHDASGMVREEITKILSDSALAGKTTIRLHDGDPSIYGAIREQMDSLEKIKISSEIIPGVTSFLAQLALYTIAAQYLSCTLPLGLYDSIQKVHAQIKHHGGPMLC